jgi:hypothetical protein
MRGIGRSGDGDDRSGIGNLVCCSEHGSAAEAMADQKRWRLVGLAQVIGGSHEIGNVGGEGRIGEVTFARTEAGEIEPQHRNAFCGERHRNPLRGQAILAASEAMRKQRVGADFTFRLVQCGGQLLALPTGKLKSFGGHGRLRAWEASPRW